MSAPAPSYSNADKDSPGGPLPLFDAPPAVAWTADVEFPGRDRGQCRGCGASIGWITARKSGRPCPVEVRGWSGHRTGGGEYRLGLTLEGDFFRVVRPLPTNLAQPLVPVFENHFGKCPERRRFER